MRRISFALTLILFTQVLCLQPSASPGKAGNYALTGFRHGVSYFANVRYPQVQYDHSDSLSFSQYHSLDVIYSWLRRWAELYPDLIDLYEAGVSYEGRPVYQITLTNKKAGKDTDKPAAYFEGGRHSGEVTASESVLWLTRYLLENYGKDSGITHIIDTKTLYLRPVNNPDGHNLYMNSAQSNRSTVRPVDNDEDGLMDEDAAEDLDSNGIILTMRWKDQARANMIPDTTDHSGRLMKPVGEGKGIYRVADEGYDNDKDGKINEDGIGGLDLHRNYPENWRPSKEYTGRGFTQYGAGEYTLSESETRSVVAFLLGHPNVYVVNSMDTSVPMHLRPPSTSSSDEGMYKEDLQWYKYFDEAGRKITGYEKAGDVYDDYGDGTPLFGHGPDFGYFYFGAIWYGDEIWNGAKNKDYNSDGKIDDVEILRWDEEDNEGLGFHEWKSFRHPDYGEVEIGGFDPKFFLQNPPPRYLEKWIRNEAFFNLEMIRHLPELAWQGIEIKKVKSYGPDSSDYKITVAFRNNGKLPTALKQAQLVKIVTNDRIILEFDTAGYNGKQLFRPVPEKKDKSGKEKAASYSGKPTNTFSADVPVTMGESATSKDIVLRFYSNREIKGKAVVLSTRGGVLKDREFVLR